MTKSKFHIDAERSDREKACFNCGSKNVEFSYTNAPFDYLYKGKLLELDAEALVGTCTDCGFEFTGESAEFARHNAVCMHLGLLTSDEIVGIRESYGLSREELASLTGLGVASIGRWETADTIQNSSGDKLLKLTSYPENKDRLSSNFSNTAQSTQRQGDIQRAMHVFEPEFRLVSERDPQATLRSEQFSIRPQ